MSSSEKLCLKWNDFQENILSGFKDLRQGNEFTDVTLACEDGQQVGAHKIVLTSFSPLFKNLLKSNKHQHPIVYMRGVKSDELHAILDFLYCGEANVYQEHLDSFLAMADELKLKGLTGNGNEKEHDESPSVPTNDFKREPFYRNEPTLQKRKQPETELRKSFETQTERTLSLVNSTVSTDLNQLDEQIKSMIDSSENFVTRKNGKQQRAYVCKMCSKELRDMTDMTRHVEANHLTDIAHSCDICGKISRSRNGLRLHTSKEHKY